MAYCSSRNLLAWFIYWSFHLAVRLARWVAKPIWCFNKYSFDGIIYPTVEIISKNLLEWAVFMVGLGVILLRFNLFDKFLLKMSILYHISIFEYLQKERTPI